MPPRNKVETLSDGIISSYDIGEKPLGHFEPVVTAMQVEQRPLESTGQGPTVTTKGTPIFSGGAELASGAVVPRRPTPVPLSVV